MKGRNKIVILKGILISIITIGIVYIVIENYVAQDIEKQIGSSQIVQNMITKESNTENDKKVTFTKIYPKEQIIEEYKGYDVCAKLEIPVIELETYVLKNYSTQALNISVTKFWGVDPNEIGNFCVAGHNFINKNMFRNLKKLNIGDKLILTDNTIGKIEYEIFDIYTVIPEDTSCLFPVIDGKREITLITCTNDSSKRIIVKAREVEA